MRDKLIQSGKRLTYRSVVPAYAPKTLNNALLLTGITSKIIPILEETRGITDTLGPIALQVLMVMTQHGGPEARVEVARSNRARGEDHSSRVELCPRRRPAKLLRS